MLLYYKSGKIARGAELAGVAKRGFYRGIRFADAQFVEKPRKNHLKSFDPTFLKVGGVQRRSLWSPSAEGETPYSREKR